MKTIFLLFLLWFGLADEVLICKSGGAYAYHSHQCRGLKECTHTIEKVSLKEAVALKRKPCEWCYDTNPAPALPAKTGQCSATTKKGAKCSRKAESNGYCWQHSK